MNNIYQLNPVLLMVTPQLINWLTYIATHVQCKARKSGLYFAINLRSLVEYGIAVSYTN